MKKMIYCALPLLVCITASLAIAFQGSPGGGPGGPGSGGNPPTPPVPPTGNITAHSLTYSSNGQTPPTFSVDSSVSFFVNVPAGGGDSWASMGTLTVEPIGSNTSSGFDMAEDTSYSWTTPMAQYNGPQGGWYHSFAELEAINVDPFFPMWITLDNSDKILNVQ